MRKTWKSYKTSSPIALRKPKKNLVWEDIAAAVNAVGVALRTTQEIKDKRKNLQSAAKKEFSGFRKEQKKTGGGPARPKPSEATLKIIEIFSETPSFTGLQGFETGRFAGGNVCFCGYLKCNEKRIPYRLRSFTLAVLRILLREDKKKRNIFKIMRINMIR